MQMNYISEKNNFSNCILGIAFLSSLIYFAETIIIIQKPIEEYLSLEVKTNDTAIFYFFRQLNFILLLGLTLLFENQEQRNLSRKKHEYLYLLAGLAISIACPIIAHNLSSYNPEYNLVIADYTDLRGKTIWNISYINILIIFWTILTVSIVLVTKLDSNIWNSIIIICFSAIVYNFFLLLLDVYNLSIWYIGRTVEVISKLFVIFTLMYNVFSKLTECRDMATKDPLTQIYNRRYYFSKLEKIIDENSAKNVCVMMIDIDNFKMFNDTWGHPMGDRVILVVADLIKKNVRSEDILARLGGEEFGVIMMNINPTDAEKLAERIRRTIESRTQNGNGYNIPKTVTLSIGLLNIENTHSTISQVNHLVDKALYDAKRKGKNCVVVKTLNAMR
ncbi:GGDEF domain-containing protein [Klebsiella variicola]|uniref:sensor domain-containing diguanylate cyclase n=1 Tax=Klebsiella variicola TaxID=244366 RepID=UPI002FF90593